MGEPNIAEETATTIVDAALKLHRAVGPGLLESVYEAVLAKRLENLGCDVRRQVRVPIRIDGITFREAFRADILVNQHVLVEVKSVEALLPVHSKQVLTYLRLTNLTIGFLINFGGSTLKSGLRRIVNNMMPSSPSRLRVNQPSTGTNSLET